MIDARRKETVERSFADAKKRHGHRYARFRGLSKVQAQCLLAAACQNMKKIARILAMILRALLAYPEPQHPKCVWIARTPRIQFE